MQLTRQISQFSYRALCKTVYSLSAVDSGNSTICIRAPGPHPPPIPRLRLNLLNFLKPPRHKAYKHFALAYKLSGAEEPSSDRGGGEANTRNRDLCRRCSAAPIYIYNLHPHELESHWSKSSKKAPPRGNEKLRSVSNRLARSRRTSAVGG